MARTGTPGILRFMNRGERIRALARANGFSLVGIAKVPADGRAPGADFFTEWIARGRHGPLAYLADTAAQRVRLHERFSWARSVLCVGACHDGPAAKSRLDGLEARGPGTQPSWVPGRDLLSRVAGYARGRDYHLVFERRLKAVARALIAERLCGRTHWHVDTGPVLERAWAAAAGLGWIGKNNCLIHPRYGSYILLGEILLDAEVEADVAQPDRCGTCRRCLEACPTGALRGPRDLDAARCIATWTLETKGAPSNDSAIAAHGWVAGCDLCQNVCPFNGPRRAGAGDPELAVAGWHDLDLARTILLSRDEYDRLFRASALRRVGWQGLRLNAIRAAATCRDSATRAALRACLEDPDPQIREAAQQALNVAV